MPISPVELAKKGKKDAERVILLVNKFELTDAAAPELVEMFKPVKGELYKAVKDVKQGIYYLDIPETLERDGGGWAFSDLKSEDKEFGIVYELTEVTKENANKVDLAPNNIIKLANWLDEPKLIFSWEQEESESLNLPASREEWEEVIQEDMPQGVENALTLIKELNPELYGAIAIALITISLQEQGVIPSASKTQDLIVRGNDRYGATIGIAALLDSHVGRANIPNMIGVSKLAFTEIARLLEGDVLDLIEAMNKRLKE